jgi:very-short-patch-repair endonuclease
VDRLGDGNDATEEMKDFGSNFPSQRDSPKVSDWEKFFYEKLYQAGVRTMPQFQVGQYSLDLAIIDGDRKLDIEVDGVRYHRNWDGELLRKDQLRNMRLIEQGWDVKRFWVYEIRDDLEWCIEDVKSWTKS